MQNPGKPGAGFSGARVISLDGDARSLPDPATVRNKSHRARSLAEAADLHLQRGQHAIAERLSWLAAEARA